MTDEKESTPFEADDLFPILDQCPEERTDFPEDVTSCASCPVSDCPSRGLADPEQMKAILEAEKTAPLTPAQMTLSSLLVFVLPLLFTVVGIGFLSPYTGPVPAALIGFCAGAGVARGSLHKCGV